VKVSYHIGEWYNFSKMHANHRMRSHYKLDRLKVDLNKMMLLPSVNLIYADQPSEVGGSWLCSSIYVSKLLCWYEAPYFPLLKQFFFIEFQTNIGWH